jgi:transposase
MLSLRGLSPIYLYAGAADMRKSFDGLMGLVHEAGLGDPTSGAWFVFKNRRADRLKVLYFDRDGLAIWYKRLERGRFQWPAMDGKASLAIDAGTLGLILDGVDLASVRRRKRYLPPSRITVGAPGVDNINAIPQ